MTLSAFQSHDVDHAKITFFWIFDDIFCMRKKTAFTLELVHFLPHRIRFSLESNFIKALFKRKVHWNNLENWNRTKTGKKNCGKKWTDFRVDLENILGAIRLKLKNLDQAIYIIDLCSTGPDFLAGQNSRTLPYFMQVINWILKLILR